MIHIRDGDIHLLNIRTRMPFVYGIATMTKTPHAFVRLRVEIDGKLTTGISADHLPPKWFTKNPEQPLADEIREMCSVIDQAVKSSIGIRGETVFEVCKQVWDAQSYYGLVEDKPPLLAHFGTSLVERVVIEAFCRHTATPFWRHLHNNAFGIQLGKLHPQLENHLPADFLPPQPRTEIVARHTVGMADPLTEDDIPKSERLDDGLPQSLESCIKVYGLKHFKIKVAGHIDHDLGRLRSVAAVINGNAQGKFAFSLDGNEQFQSLNDFVVFWNEMTTDPMLRSFFDHLLFVEQPFHRDIALSPEAIKALADWSERPPVIIDESDGELSSLPRALRLGYAGASHKNCKGVIKGLANACLLGKMKQEQPLSGILMSGEDLATIGPVALLQDLAVCAALGIESVERNGHHFFAGLSMFPDEVQQQMLKLHSDLYHSGSQGWPSLNVHDGRLRIDSVNQMPFGVGFSVDVERYKPLSDFRLNFS